MSTPTSVADPIRTAALSTDRPLQAEAGPRWTDPRSGRTSVWFRLNSFPEAATHLKSCLRMRRLAATNRGSGVYPLYLDDLIIEARESEAIELLVVDPLDILENADCHLLAEE